MTKEEAATLLGVSTNAAPNEVRQRYQELYSEYQIRLTNAPTPGLKKAYQKNLQEFQEASQTLCPQSLIDSTQDLPAAQPSLVSEMEVLTPSNRSRAVAKSDAISSAPAPDAMQAGLPKSTMIAAVLGVICLAAASFFGIKWTSATGALAKQEEQGALLKQIAPLLQNGKFEVQNQSAMPVTIISLGATYLDDEGKYKTYNSTDYEEDEWELRPGQRMKREKVVGTKTVWDGRVIFYAVDLRYKGQGYLLIGAWKNLEGGVLKIALD